MSKTKLMWNYIPKNETQTSEFLKKYPKYDGRGIKIAIIDSVIDVSLEGMQKTSEGLSKIIDCFDFTGAGDVDTSVIRKMNCENILISLSGRKFKIPQKWNNPSGNWHLGVKSLYKPLIPSTTEKSSKENNNNVFKNVSPQSLHNNEIEKLPEMDCIVWFDGKKWLACIDTLGDLEDAKVLTNFRGEHEYGILSNHFNLSYCITVHNDGNLLEIYAPYCNHGSVVAQIAAAFCRRNPDGLAPGAQIISMNVSDPGRNNLMNVVALKKALLKCIEMKVDIVNYSIESFTGDPEIEKIIAEMVNKHNILIFKSAGNSGPFYVTVNKCDVLIRNLIFTIGALVTPEMNRRLYDVYYRNSDNPLTSAFFSSSRGPDINGNLGIDFVAPGAAITHIPKFNVTENETFNGTSNSSPYAAGAVACLLSALKENSIQYSPSLIKFVLSKTACALETGNKLDFGHGVIQIAAAFEYYKNMIDFKMLKRLQEVGGILFTQRDQDHDVKEFVLDLPSLNHTVADKPEEWILQLSPLSAESYIQISKIDDENEQLSVKLDTSTLESGTLTFAEILVQHPFYPSMGSIFNIPITVIVPISLKEINNVQKQILLVQDNPYHLFIDPDLEGTCEIKITLMEKVETKLYINYAINVHDIKIGISEKILKFTSESQTQTYTFPFEKKEIHEICLRKSIGCLLCLKFKLEFDFTEKED